MACYFTLLDDEVSVQSESKGGMGLGECEGYDVVLCMHACMQRHLHRMAATMTPPRITIGRGRVCTGAVGRMGTVACDGRKVSDERTQLLRSEKEVPQSLLRLADLAT